VRVTVVEIGRGQVKLAVEAPRSVAVDRAEIRARKRTHTLTRDGKAIAKWNTVSLDGKRTGSRFVGYE